MNIVTAIPKKWRCLYGGHDKMSWNYGFIETTTKIYLRCKIKGNRKKNTKDKEKGCYRDKFTGMRFVSESVVEL